MEITKNNYEAYLLDFFEGNLSAALVEELRLFVLHHPELEIDLNDTSLVTVPSLEVKADFKETLKKQEDALEDEEILRYLEGLMPGKEKQAFVKRLSEDDRLQASLAQYQRTILETDFELKLEDKSTLIKTEDDLVLNNPVITYVEGKLSLEEKAGFEMLLSKDDELRADLRLVLASKLVPDIETVYPAKESLKKEVKVFALFDRSGLFRVAAAILLLACLSVVFSLFQVEEKTERRVSYYPKVKSAKTESNLEKELKLNSVKDISATTAEDQGKTNSELALNPMPKSPRNKIIAETGKKDTSSKTESVQFKVDMTSKKIDSDLLASRPAEKNASQKTDTSNMITHKVTELVVVEEWEEVGSAVTSGKREKGLWKRAVQLAKQANKLGVKSVDGVEDSRTDRYRISFNSFSVEKK